MVSVFVWVLIRVEDTEFAKQLVYIILYCILFIVLSFCVYRFANSVSPTQNKSRLFVFLYTKTAPQISLSSTVVTIFKTLRKFLKRC